MLTISILNSGLSTTSLDAEKNSVVGLSRRCRNLTADLRGVVWVVEADEPELDQVESSCSSNNKKEDVEAQKLTDTARLES
jgi:hypothetical protein